MNLSKLLGAPVKLKHGEGYILSVHADGQKIAYFTCVDENEREIKISARDMAFSLEGEVRAAVINPPEKIEKRLPALYLMRPATNSEGNFLGLLEDVIIEKGEVRTLIVSGKHYCAKGARFSDFVMLQKSPRKIGSECDKSQINAASLAARDLLLEALCSDDDD